MSNDIKVKLLKSKLRVLTEELSKDLYICIEEYKDSNFYNNTNEFKDKLKKIINYYINEIDEI